MARYRPGASRHTAAAAVRTRYSRAPVRNARGGASVATIAGCPLFPPDFSTNQRVDLLPVAPDPAANVRSIGLDGTIHADFGSGLWEGGPIGIPYDVVGRRTPRSRVRFEYADESDRVRYPIPP